MRGEIGLGRKNYNCEHNLLTDHLESINLALSACTVETSLHQIVYRAFINDVMQVGGGGLKLL